MTLEPFLKIIISSEKFVLTPKFEKYAYRKLHGLEKFIPKAARQSAFVEVRLKQAGRVTKPTKTCDLTLHLPKASLHARETTEHMYAALDVASVSLRSQISEYKAQHEPAKLRYKIIRAFGRGTYSD